MNHFIVMQGHTYQEEKELGIIWSPKKIEVVMYHIHGKE